jgi:protein tyrosine phosphatase (PTP) superfamily phosphohydrolase (DUF442 family)
MYTQVDSSLWRGPRPTSNDLATIKAQFATVISLEGLDEDAKELLELRPVLLVSRPISFWQIYFTGITQLALYDILSAIAEAQKPALVHCEHGRDRTGLVVAAYQVIAHGMSKDGAMEQAIEFGYRYYLNLGLNRTWEHFSATLPRTESP